MQLSMYGFEKDNIPAPYYKIDWTDKLERTNRDYGEIFPANPGYIFQDWERSKDYLAANVF